MAWNPKSMRLWQEIILTLAFKAVLLITLWAVCFSAPQGRTVDGQQAAAQIFSQQFLKEQNHDAHTGTR